MSLWDKRDFSPMLLKETNEAFDSNEYIFELKFDGQRACIFVGPNEFKILNRHNKFITELYPELEEIKKIVNKNTIFDGEIVAFDKGVPSFSKLQQRAHLKDKKKIRYQSINNPVIFIAFDILYQKKDLINKTIEERKKILDRIPDNDFFIKIKTYENCGKKIFKFTKKHNLEGIVAKKKKSLYLINKRSNLWIKIKNNEEEDFFICGYKEKNNNIISIILGEYINNKLNYVGSVITTKNSILFQSIKKIKIIDNSPFSNYKKDNITYIEPKLTCKVKYMERTKNNHLRQPFIKK